MLFFRFAVVVLALCIFTSCSSTPGDMNRVTSTTQQDVVDAWDMYCAYWNFDECPANVLDPSCLVLMGGVYNGNNFADDCDGLMLCMKIELDSGLVPDPGDGIGLRSLIFDQVWFQ